MRRRRDHVTAVRILAGAIATATVFAACSGGSDSSPSPTVVTTTTEPVAPRANDGILKLGALIPMGNPGIADFLTTSLNASVDAINENGGVLGNDVELSIVDEGTSAVTASQAIEELVLAKVDAIVGPTSSNTALGSLDVAVANGIVSCSPTATAISLDDFPDEGLFFRTIATDSLQAKAIASRAQETGASNVVIVHVDDAYGRPYAEAVDQALDGPIAVDIIPLTVDDDDLSDEIDTLVAAGPQVVIVLGEGDDTATFLGELARRDDIDIPSIIVNDDARRAANRPLMSVLPAELRDQIVVIAPQIVVRGGSTGADNPPFGPQVTDCVNLLALSAVQGQSDAPSVIAGQMSSVSDGGAVCSDFLSCSDRLAGGDEIDYDGPTGITVLSRTGDPSRAFFDRLRFDDDGADIFEDEFAIQA
ncbi:ABC transporter substrate-binding protein [Ilumatobacter sp.]|uniref:ABC transporter substrate-binding protein n=1 Tax=Ilumatobacter sp. TaxID=1967498 RepID=UPI003C3ECC04